MSFKFTGVKYLPAQTFAVESRVKKAEHTRPPSSDVEGGKFSTAGEANVSLTDHYNALKNGESTLTSDQSTPPHSL